MKITKSDLQARAKNYGYTVRILDGEIEAYPTGNRGDASYFACDDQEGRQEVIAWFRADREARFKSRLSYLDINEDIKAALLEWFMYHGTEWLNKLIWEAWTNGRYDGFSTSNVSSTLQQFRNTNGHAVLRTLEPKFFGG